MKHIYLINPAAGRGDSTATISEKIKAAYPADGAIKAEIYLTKDVGDCETYVRTRCRENRESEELVFFACGGDGTFNEAVNGAAGFSYAAVGLVPCGTGNDFAKGFEHAENFLNIEAQRDGKIITLDAIRCNDVLYANLLNVGFDCAVVTKVAQIKRKPWVPGGMAYILGVALTLIRKPGVSAEISFDGGEPVNEELLLCAIGNGAFYGGGFMPLPHANMADGLLDVCYVNNVSRLKFVSLVSAYKAGKHLSDSNKDFVRYVRCRRVDVKFPSAQDVCLDGEVATMDSCHIEAIPGGMRFLLPADTELIAREALTSFATLTEAAAAMAD